GVRRGEVMAGAPSGRPVRENARSLRLRARHRWRPARLRASRDARDGRRCRRMGEGQVMGQGSGPDEPAKAVPPEQVAPRLIGELLGLLAHDLRNPLSALHSNLGYLDAVLASRDEEVREAIEDGL